jgi:hypothetical protein
MDTVSPSQTQFTKDYSLKNKTPQMRSGDFKVRMIG